MEDTRLAEIADGIHQLTTYLPEIDFSLNQYLITGDEPMLFHTGMRELFDAVAGTVGRVVDLNELHWIGFGHLEADECGSLNQFLTAAPRATAVQGTTGCMVSIGDLADRTPRPLADGEVLDPVATGSSWIDTPHVPHAWEAGLLYDHTTRTLFCGDLFSRWGAFPPSTDDDLAGMAIADDDSSWMSLAPSSPSVLRRLASFDIGTLAPMHGPAYSGDCRKALLDLSNDFQHRIDQASSVSGTSTGRGG
ncbi:MAG: MBL fold metallo-hydrolase [Acidimicrobiia bacterium]